MISKDDEWISLCELLENGEIRFTKEYLEATKELSGSARKFAAQIATHWSKEFENLLDYFGPDDAEEDWYSGVDGEPMDIREDTPEMWEYYEIPFEGLSSEWYRDVLRAKLVSIKIPKKLISQYIKSAKKAER